MGRRRSLLLAVIVSARVLVMGLPPVSAQVPEAASFRRGDAEESGRVDLSDGVRVLDYLFLAGTVSCLDALDTDGSGRLELTDALFLFNYLFLGGATPPAPGPQQCGRDPTDDALGCESYMPEAEELRCAGTVPVPAGELFKNEFVLLDKGPASMAVGDWNGDGNADMAVGRFVSSSPTVLLGDGELGFETVENSPSRFFSSELIVLESGDVNGDGVLDLIGASAEARTTNATRSHLFIGKGDGTFDLLDRVALPGLPPQGIGVGDLDGDGDLDLAVVQGLVGREALAVLVGQGDGTFAASDSQPAAFQQCFYGYHSSLPAVELDDLDLDGTLDVIASTAGGISFAHNRGDGTLFDPEAVEFACGTFGLGDFDGDGFTDLVSRGIFGTGVPVQLGDGDGTFLPPVRLEVSVDLTELLTSDMDGDGLSDIVLTHEGELTTALSRGTGAFDLLPSGLYPFFGYGMALEDFSGDGIADVTGFDKTRAQVQVLAGRDDGTFTPPANHPVSGHAFGLAVTDLDGDGILDLAASASLPERTTDVLLGRGDGTFSLTDSSLEGGGLVAAGDFDGDEVPDLVSQGGRPDRRLWLHRNRGDATFVTSEIPSVESAVFLDHGDLNGDGTLDLLFRLYENSSVALVVYSNDGRGRFRVEEPQWVSPSSYFGGTLGDLDGDGDLDVIITRANVGLLTGLNRGDGVLAPPIDTSCRGECSPQRLLDWNEDGHLDVIAYDTLYLGSGDGQLERSRSLVPRGVLIGLHDLDDDGIEDMVLRPNVPGDHVPVGVSIFRGLGARQFAEEEHYAIYGGLFADVDRDGDLDMVTTLHTGGGVHVMLNRTVP